MPSDQEVEDLLLCPFCGQQEAELTDAMPAGAYWVVCGHCGVETHSSRVRSEAIAAWNWRPPIAASSQSEPVGEAGRMPGTDGFTMAAFKADAVPVGTKLYAAPTLPLMVEELTFEFLRDECAAAWDNVRIPGDKFWNELPTNMQVLATQSFRRGVTHAVAAVQPQHKGEGE